MVMEMEAQSFNTQGLGTAQSFNTQGLDKALGYSKTVGYSGIVMESPSSLFGGGDGGWGYRNTLLYNADSNNNNNYNNYNHHYRSRLLQDGDGGMTTGDRVDLVTNIFIHHVTLTIPPTLTLTLPLTPS